MKMIDIIQYCIELFSIEDEVESDFGVNKSKHIVFIII